MCRHLAWLGEPRPVAEFVFAPEHSLLHQSYAARELLRGSVCADGFGVGWFDPSTGMAARYRRSEPIWADTDLPGVAGVIRSGAIVAAVRNGTPEIPGGVASTQPVLVDGVLASHNGYIADFARHARRLRDGLPDDLYARLTGESDSETLLLLMAAHVRRDGDLATGLARAIDVVMAVAPGSAVCVVATDGQRLVAARQADGQPCDSLYVRRGAEGTLVASEPLDADPAWAPLPEFAVTEVALRGAEVAGA